jgi:ATP-dependent Clp protease adaptor protein ClpS
MTTELDVKEKVKFQRPKKWVILLHNDDVTPMDFVVMLLVAVFNMDHVEAATVTLKIHGEGQGVAGIYSHEVAEQKLAEAHHAVKGQNLPLKVTMEEE